MPELPEVESLKRSLEPYVKGQIIQSITITKPKLVSSNGTVRIPNQTKVDEFITQLVGEKIVALNRRVKNLIFEFQSGKILLVHLKMTGQLIYRSNAGETVTGGHPIQITDSLPSKHSHLIFGLTDGTLFYNDTRMFGYLLYYSSYQNMLDDKHFANVGLEPLGEDFSQDYFVIEFKKQSGTIKKNFLENKVVVGLGNIYSDEVCFRAGVKPTRTCKSLTKPELKKVFEAIKYILPKAIDEGGSSVANYLLADGSKGNYARYHQVYNRGGKECYKCGKILKKVVLGGRTTVFCTACQK